MTRTRFSRRRFFIGAAPVGGVGAVGILASAIQAVGPEASDDAFGHRRVGLVGLATGAIHDADTKRQDVVATRGRTLPAWVYAGYGAKSAPSYTAALSQPNLMASLPCYCGCVAIQPPHRHLLDCFMKPDSSFERHASGCETCQDEALDAARWSREGKSAEEIRRLIDAEYAERGPSTERASSAT